MANYTSNYNLEKPLVTERYDVGVFNGNADIIDTTMHDNAVHVQNTQNMVAPPFDTNTAYPIGKRVTYNNRLYQFTSAHAIGAWDSSEVTEVNITDAIGTILTDTLVAGDTSITFTNALITTNSIIIPYADVYGVAPSAITVSAGSCVLTFDARQTNMLVGIQIR